jgi:hypothetical protein
MGLSINPIMRINAGLVKLAALFADNTTAHSQFFGEDLKPEEQYHG